jgi:hypothetical protein
MGTVAGTKTLHSYQIVSDMLHQWSTSGCDIGWILMALAPNLSMAVDCNLIDSTRVMYFCMYFMVTYENYVDHNNAEH